MTRAIIVVSVIVGTIVLLCWLVCIFCYCGYVKGSNNLAKELKLRSKRDSIAASNSGFYGEWEPEQPEPSSIMYITHAKASNA